MSRGKARVDRIRSEVSTHKLLMDYGYPLRGDAGDHEEQFPCDLHGGHDNSPSARFYPSSNSWFCFSCSRSRDAIQTVVEKEGVGFWDAVRLLEKKFRLPQLPWDADVARPMNMTDVVHDALKERETVEEVSARVERMLFFMKRDGDCDHVKLLRMWEAHDRILYGHRREGWKEEQTVRLLTQLIERITNAQDSQG